MAQISPKLFSQDLAKQIFADNVFYTKGQKDIAAGNVESVDIPIAGTLGAAKSGNPVLPLQIIERTDDIKNYALTQVYADPILVKREEDIVLSYNKQADIARAMGEAISTKCADIAANAYGTSDTSLIVATTGAARTTTLVGATLTRKAITKVDLMKVRNLFMRQNISLQGIIGVITPDQYNDILGIAEFVDFEKTGVSSKLEAGILGRILGMDIMVRWNDALGSVGLHYDANGVKKANGAVAVTDCAAALFFQPNLVRYAEAFPETIINRKPAGYLGGTIIEAVVRFGATQSRGDSKGIVCIREAS
jgi:hypothetical protein